MANSLKPHMDSIVSPNATAFIPGRSIHDNIVLAQQMIHYHDNEKIGAGLLGIDFEQAYTYLSQEYILAVLEAMNFPSLFLKALELSFKDQTGRVIVNGDLTERFPVDNGGKQGDPLFPLV